MFKFVVTIILLSSSIVLTSCAGTAQFAQTTNRPVELKELVGIYQLFAHAGFYVEISEHQGELFAQGNYFEIPSA